MQEGEPLYLSDPKYIYEHAVIETDKIGNKDYKIFRYNTKLSTVEYYDIVASNYNYTFGTSLSCFLTSQRPQVRTSQLGWST